jgi:hypothetical protein
MKLNIKKIFNPNMILAVLTRDCKPEYITDDYTAVSIKFFKGLDVSNLQHHDVNRVLPYDAGIGERLSPIGKIWQYRTDEFMFMSRTDKLATPWVFDKRELQIFRKFQLYKIHDEKLILFYTYGASWPQAFSCAKPNGLISDIKSELAKLSGEFSL